MTRTTNPNSIANISNEAGVRDLPMEQRRAFAKAIQAEREGDLDTASTALETALEFDSKK